MVVSKEKIKHILEGYDKDNLVIATACSHTSLQIFDGARKEGFKTLGITVGQKTKFYDAFPKGKPDEFFYVDSYTQLLDKHPTTDYRGIATAHLINLGGTPPMKQPGDTEAPGLAPK